MVIDVPTLLIFLVLVCVVIGALFLSGWYRDRGDGLALRAASGPGVIAIGIALFLLKGTAPDFLSVVIAYTLITAGFGLMWSAARAFEHQSTPVPAILAGSAIWLVASTVPEIYDTIALRISVPSLIAAGYAVAIGFEFWRGRDEKLAARLPMVVLCFAHAFVVCLRVVALIAIPLAGAPFGGNWIHNLLLFAPPVTLIGGAFLAISMVRERAERHLRRDAEMDALTDIFNRRAFFDRSRAAVANATKAGRAVVLLLFDLDHFKTINDRFGHAVGDETLRLFARVATGSIRSTDVFGRIGGEEFAALLPGCDALTAQRIADRIRVDFSSQAVTHDGAPLAATVSIGVAAMDGSEADVDILMARADDALYQSKRSGRDRVSGVLAVAS